MNSIIYIVILLASFLSLFYYYDVFHVIFSIILMYFSGKHLFSLFNDYLLDFNNDKDITNFHTNSNPNHNIIRKTSDDFPIFLSDKEIIDNISKKIKINKNINDLTFIEKKKIIINEKENKENKEIKLKSINTITINEVYQEIINMLKNNGYIDLVVENIAKSIILVRIINDKIFLYLDSDKVKDSSVTSEYLIKLFKSNINYKFIPIEVKYKNLYQYLKNEQ